MKYVFLTLSDCIYSHIMHIYQKIRIKILFIVIAQCTTTPSVQHTKKKKKIYIFNNI